MKNSWLYQGQRRLIIFCNGWGMDDAPFQPLGAKEYDVLMLFDYTDLTTEIDFSSLLNGYDEVNLIAWSMGVWVGQQLFTPWASLFRRSVAINGTLCPIDDQFGIPVHVYRATLSRFSEAGRLKFYRRMCRERGTLEMFLGHQPQRSMESQARELEALQEMAGCDREESALYTHILIANQDLVMPTAHQVAFWKEREGRERVVFTGFHFPFYGWCNWDDLVDGSA